MAKQVQLRRGSSALTNNFTGAQGEVTVDTDRKVAVVHDGETQGGFGVGARANPDGTIELINNVGTVLVRIETDGTIKAAGDLQFDQVL